jgi:hypothetical protein
MLVYLKQSKLYNDNLIMLLIASDDDQICCMGNQGSHFRTGSKQKYKDWPQDLEAICSFRQLTAVRNKNYFRASPHLLTDEIGGPRDSGNNRPVAK